MHWSSSVMGEYELELSHDLSLVLGDDVAESQIQKMSRKEADVNSILVGLYDMHREYVDHPEQYPHYKEAVCRKMTDLLDAQLRDADREMMTDVFVTLLRQSERDLKQALAERLSVLDDVPLRLLLQLVNDDISIARPIIEYSPVLNDLDLLYIIQSRDTTFWQMIAARKYINENVVDALADTHDMPTAKVLVRNDTISFSEYSLNILEEMAAQDDELASPLLMRPDVPEKVARFLYAHVGADLKSYIAAHCDVSGLVGEAVEDVVREFSVSHAASDFTPTNAMVRAADMFMKQGKLDANLMVRTLQRGQVPSFVAQLSSFAGLTPEIILSLLKRENGQGLALVARVSGISFNDFFAMFLLLQRLQAVSAPVSKEALDKAKAYYNKIDKELASKILNHSRD